MIKFFLLLFTTIVLYLFFSIVGEYDSDVHIEFLNYVISIRGFFLVITIFLSYIIFAIIIKILSFIINAPRIITKLVTTSKIKQNQKKLTECYAMITCGNYKRAYELINKIKKELPPEFHLDIHLILSVTENDDEARIYNLKYLLDFSEYKNFASYELAKYFFKHQYYQQSLEYAQNLTDADKDIEILNLLTDLYIKMNNWPSFEDSIVKMKYIDESALGLASSKIADGYFLAAKDSLGSDDNSRARYYLEEALSHQPYLLEAIELLCYLNNNEGKTNLNKKIIETAFSLNPSFDLFLIYIKSDVPSKKIYSYLASLVDPKNHLGVFLAIASYLGLKEEIEDLKSSILQ